MPNQRFKSENYENLGGINLKSSAYITGPREVLSLYNTDFSVPGALTGRPGSSMYIGQTFNQILGFQEFEKADGYSTIFLVSASSFWAINNTTATGITQFGFGPTFNCTLTSIYVTYSFGSGGGGGAANYLQFEDNSYQYTIKQPLFSTNTFFDFAQYSDHEFASNGQNAVKFNASYLTKFGLPRPYLMPINLALTGSPLSFNDVDNFGNVILGFTFGFFYGIAMAYENFRGFVSSPSVFLNLDLRGASPYNVLGSTRASAYVNVNVGIPLGYGINKLHFYSTDGNASLLTSPLFKILELPINQASYGITLINTVLIGGGSSFTTKGSTFARNSIPNTLPGAFPEEWIFFGETFLQSNTTGSGIADQTAYTFSFIEIYSSKVFLSGISQDPSRVYFSDTGEPEGILPENTFIVESRNSDKVTGLRTYYSQLVIFKDRSVFALTGSSGENFVVREVTDQYGCLNNRANVVFNERLWFLDQKGICEYNGSNVSIISDKMEGDFDRMNLDAAKSQATMIHNKQRSEVWCSIPVDGATLNNLTIIYDYEAEAWARWDGFSPRYMNMMKARLTKSTGFFADNSGRLNQFSGTFFGDNGSGISLVVKPRFEHPMGQSVEKQFRRLFVNADSLTGQSIISLNVNYRKNYSESIAMTQGMTLTTFQNVNNFGIPAKSLSPEIGFFSATDRIRFYGYTLEYRYQRST